MSYKSLKAKSECEFEMSAGNVEDLAELSDLDETILLKAIQARYEKEKIYVGIHVPSLIG